MFRRGTILVLATALSALSQPPVGSARLAPAGPAAPADPVIVAAGDIACDPGDGGFNQGRGTASACRQAAVSDLLVNGRYAAVLTLGDNQYDDGRLDKFGRSYDPSWGRVRAVTHPSPGNHDYETDGGAGYFDYFGRTAGPRDLGYYSFDVGAWHIVSLNSNCWEVGCARGSAQERWLRADLATHASACTLAYWHHPLFSSGPHGNNPSVIVLWRDLYRAGADVVLNGHDHDYERFAPQTPAGVLDSDRGIREFVVGTGGESHYAIGGIRPNSRAHDSSSFGVLELRLHRTSYEWRFVPAAGGTFTDSGLARCH